MAAALSRVVLRELTPSERDFQARVVQLARQRGWLVYFTHSSRHSPKGYPDLCCVDPATGRTLYAELKVAPRKPTPEQYAWLAAFARNPGLETYVWTCDWTGDVMREIAEVLAR